MSLQSHTLTVGATTKTLAAWGVESCRVTVRNSGEDEMSLTLAAKVDAAPAFGAFSILTLKDSTGTIRFKGRVLQWEPSADGRSESHGYSVAGPWQYLKEVTYQQLHQFPEDPEDVAASLTLENSSRVILQRNPATGEARHIQQQIDDALQYAVDADAPIAFNSTNLPTTQPPEDQALDLPVADVVNRVLRWAPHLGRRWDYSGGTPLLEFGDTTLSGAVFPGIVHGFGDRVLALTDSNLTGWSGRPRWDLLCPRFEICYIGENRATSDGASVKWRTIHRDVSTATVGSIAADAFGGQVSTVLLRGGVWDGENWTAGEPMPADGLAASLHKAYKQLFYEMSWTRTAQEVDWTPQPGERWSVTGGSAGFASALSVCQEITRDIGAGTTTIQTGPPTYLGLADRMALLIPNRTRGISQAAGESQYGMGSPDPADEAGTDQIDVALTVVTDTQEVRKVTIRGTVGAAL